MNFQAFASASISRLGDKFLARAVLTFAVGMAFQGLIPSTTQAADVPELPRPAQASLQSVSPAEQAQALPNGVYLYGQSSSAEQIGSEYVVFEVRNSKVVGAFYMPSSSFDCFQGQLQRDRLSMTVVSTYEKESYPYSVALQRQAVSASAGNPEVTPVELAGFHPLNQISANDQRILSTCKANFSTKL